MSAAADPSVLDGGFDGFLAKLFDLDHLIRLVDELLRDGIENSLLPISLWREPASLLLEYQGRWVEP